MIFARCSDDSGGAREHAVAPDTTAPSWSARAALVVIAAYRVLLSPFVGGACRYTPSCSVYAEEAFRVHGAVRGGWLTLGRLARCRPFARYGFDPVPPRETAGSAVSPAASSVKG